MVPENKFRGLNLAHETASRKQFYACGVQYAWVTSIFPGERDHDPAI